MGPSQRWRTNETSTGELSILHRVSHPTGPQKVCVKGRSEFVVFFLELSTTRDGRRAPSESPVLFRFEGVQLMPPSCAASLLGCFSSCDQPPLKENRWWFFRHLQCLIHCQVQIQLRGVHEPLPPLRTRPSDRMRVCVWRNPF